MTSTPIEISASAHPVAAVLALAFAVFCFWMLCACVYREEDRDVRISWAIVLILIGALAAPFYFWTRYRPLRATRDAEERRAEAARNAEISDLTRRGA